MLIVDFQLLSLTYWGIDFLDLNHQIRLEWIDLVLRIVALLSHGDVRYHAVRVRWLPRKGCPIVQLTSHSMPWIQSLWMNLDGSKITMLGILVLANHLFANTFAPYVWMTAHKLFPLHFFRSKVICVCQEKFVPPEPQLCPTVATAHQRQKPWSLRCSAVPKACHQSTTMLSPAIEKYASIVARGGLTNMGTPGWLTVWHLLCTILLYWVECNNGIFAGAMFTVNMYRHGILVIWIGQITVMQSESIPAILDVGGSLAIWFRCTTGLDIWI